MEDMMRTSGRTAVLLLCSGCVFWTIAAQAQNVSLSATSISFGNVVVGATSTRNLSITNTGSSNLVIASITTTANYQWSNCGTATIAPNGSCSVSVSFAPTTTGSRNGSLTITDNASNSPQVVSLSGSGIQPVTLSPTGLQFPNQAVGTTSLAKTITLTNSQSVALNITSITTTGPFAASSCATPLQAQSSCTINVTFTPNAVGSSSGTLTVNDDASNSPQTAGLNGSGASPVTLSPSGTMSFSNQAVNTTSNPKSVTITNNQSVALNIGSVSTTGPFSASGCATSVPAYSSCSVSVTFTPVATGTF